LVLVAACSDDNGSSSAAANSAQTSTSSTSAPSTSTPASAPTTTAAPATSAAEASTTTEAPSTSVATEATAIAPEGDAFYQPPSPLPGSKPGDLIWFAPATNAPAGLTGIKMLYRSETAAGDPIAVSGVVVYSPSVPGLNAPLLTFGHGTTGLGDPCAPTRLPSLVDSGYVDMASQQGWVYVGTDYEGLGTPGDHPYLMGQSEGRGILDAARAAMQLPNSPVGAKSPVVISGHSQGGGAALAAAELAGSYAPDLDVRGVVGIAPPSELALIIQTLASAGGSAFLPMILAGAHAVDPQLDMSLAGGPDALAVVDEAANSCGNDFFEKVTALDPSKFGFTDPTGDPAWAQVLMANSPGHIASNVPVLIVHGDADNIVPPGLSQLIQTNGCAVGQTIQRNVYAGANHISVLGASHDDAVAWINDRLAGTTPAPSNCP
jgi:pimeloyl-ACP methyl ester carboxylesterase